MGGAGRALGRPVHRSEGLGHDSEGRSNYAVTSGRSVFGACLYLYCGRNWAAPPCLVRQMCCLASVGDIWAKILGDYLSDSRAISRYIVTARSNSWLETDT